MIDTHTHLNFAAFKDDWQEVADRSVAAGVEKMIVVGTDIATSQKAIAMAATHPALYAAVGIHPHHAKGIDAIAEIDPLLEKLEAMAHDARVVAIGEIGIDHHEYTGTQYNLNEIDVNAYNRTQVQLFLSQLDLASRLHKPVIVHSRAAKDEALRLIEEYTSRSKKQVRGVFHCFEGSKKLVKRVIDAGLYISFTANITYIPDRLDVATLVPLDRLLLETDCPYMSPAAMRTERNTPASVTMVAAAHAASRNIDVTQVEMHTDTNARTLFHLDHTS